MNVTQNTYREGTQYFEYLLCTPNGYQPEKESLPLMIYLHGVGSRGESIEGNFDNYFLSCVEKTADEKRVIVLCPQDRNFYVWNTQVYFVKRLIDYVADKCNADKTRISITGASMGGYGTWEMLLSFPNFFSAAAPVCGGGMEWRAPLLKNVDIWAIHGEEDPTVDVSKSKKMVESINKNGGHAKLTVCEGVGHNSWVNAYKKLDVFDWLISKQKRFTDVFVAACGEGGGVYRYTLDNVTSEMTLNEKLEIGKPMYLAKNGSTLYTLLRDIYPNREDGIVKIDLSTDRMVSDRKIIPSYGKALCHLIVDKDDTIYCVNYLTGNFVKTDFNSGRTELVQHKGKSVHPTRQEKEHTHQCAFTPDGKYITVCDLGCDEINVYNKALCLVSKVSAPKGAGPRHMIFSKDGAFGYCINELDNTVSVYSYCDGTLAYLNSYEMLKENSEGVTTAAAIRLSNDERFLYASTRGLDTIVTFAVENGKLTLIDSINCGGTRPRDFNLTPDGAHLVCTNEGGTVVLFKVDTQSGKLHPTGTEFEAPGALCVIFA